MADPMGWYGHRPGYQSNPLTGQQQYLQGGQSFLPSGDIATHKGGYNPSLPQMQPLSQQMGQERPPYQLQESGGQNPMGSQMKPPSMPMFGTQQMSGQNIPQNIMGGQLGNAQWQGLEPQGQEQMMPKMDFAEFFRKVQAGEMEAPPGGRPLFDPAQLQQQQGGMY